MQMSNRTKRRFGIALLVIVLSFGVVACNEESGNEHRDPFEGYHEEFKTPTPSPTPVLQDGLDDLQSISVSPTDCRWYLDSEQCTEDEEAFYLIVNGWIVRCDKETGEARYWCEQENCEHGKAQNFESGNSICGARLTKMEDFLCTEYYYNKIYAYDGNIYLLAKTGEGAYLQGFSAPGEKSGAPIFVTEEQDMSYRKVVMHRGKVYYTLSDGVYVRDMTTGEGEQLYVSKEDTYIGNIRVKGETLYIATYADTAKVLALDLTDRHTEVLAYAEQDRVLGYALTEEGDIYYFAPGKGLCQYDAQTKMTRVLWAEDTEAMRDVSYDGRYLCVDNQNAIATDKEVFGWLKVFSTEGELLRKMDFVGKVEDENTGRTVIYKRVDNVLGGNGQFYFAQLTNQLFVLDKSDDKLKWEKGDVDILVTYYETK